MSRLVLAVVGVGACVLGCGHGAPAGAPSNAVPVSRMALSGQIAAVRAGDSARIIAAAPLSSVDWESLRGLRGVRELVLERGAADDGRTAIIATLPDLERLVLRESPLTDAGFERLAACANLRNLNVPQADCTAAGIRALAALTNLRSLRLGGPRLEGAAVGEAVAELDRLRSLHLIDVPIGDAGLAAISRLPGLWNLYLDGAGVSDEAWAEYFQVHPDVHVHVDQAHHDRDPRRGHDGPPSVP